MSDETPIVDITITAPDADWLTAHCRHLVEKRLAASANIIPAIKSIYRWQGKVLEGTEAYAILHTRAEHFEEISRLTKEAHPYETVHILAQRLSSSDGEYRSWIAEQTSSEA